MPNTEHQPNALVLSRTSLYSCFPCSYQAPFLCCVVKGVEVIFQNFIPLPLQSLMPSVADEISNNDAQLNKA